MKAFWKENLFRNRSGVGLALVWLAAAVFLGLESDTWWTLRAGQDILHGEDIFVERWSWTRAGAFWPNHELSWEVLIYLLYKAGGSTFALVIFGASLLSALPFLFAIPAKRTHAPASRSDSMMKAGVFFIYALTYFHLYGYVRAYVASLALFAFTLWLLRLDKNRWLPLVILVWANFHAGFIMGCMAIFVAFLLRLGEYLKHRSPETLSKVKELLVVGVASFFASLVNPLGWNVWTYILTMPTKTNETVIEWLPITKVPLYCLFLVVACGLLTGALYFKKLVMTWEVKLMLVFYLITLTMTVLMSRNFMFLLVVMITLLHYVLDPQEGDAHQQEVGRHRAPARRSLLRITSMAVIAATILGVSSLNSGEKSYVISPEAVEAYRSCPGNQWNDYTSGGILIWHAPDRPVFQDNRFDYFSNEMRLYLMLSPGWNWKLYMDDHKISCMFIKKTEASYPTVANDKSGVWKQTFEDKVYSQWTRVTPLP